MINSFNECYCTSEMRTATIFFICFTTTFILNSQNNSKQILGSFEIKICDKPQKIIFNEFNDNSYEGMIITSVSRKKRNISKTIIDTLKLEQQKSQRLILELKKNWN